MSIQTRIRKSALYLTPCIHGAKIQEIAEITQKNPCDILDFSVNINPLAPPGLKEVIAGAYDSISNYPDNRYPDFKKAAAYHLKVSPENIVPGNGSSELIRLFAETVIEPGDRVLIPSPTFGEYQFQCRLFGANIEHMACGSIINANIEGLKAVFLCNPNNPTGKLTERGDIIRFAEKCVSSEVFLFVDEAFIELSDPCQSIADIAAQNDFVIVLRSLTKTYAVPGLRIGFAAASSDMAHILNNVRLHWNVNSIALAAGEKLLLNSQDYIEKSLELIKKERQWMTEKLWGIRGFRPYQSDTNFILIDIHDFAMNSVELYERMLRQGIIIRECASFGLENHIRVAVRRRSENQKLIKAFLNVITEWGNERAENEIGRALDRGTAARSRIDCEYYHCHFAGQDCTFCFCPFYPCENEKTGGELIRRSAGGSVWSCARCSLIHKGDVAEKVLKELMKGKTMKEVWEIVMEPEL